MAKAQDVSEASVTCPLDGDGFLAQPDEWTEQAAVLLAEGDGLRLGEAHWQVIRCLRDHFDRKRTAPTMRDLRLATGLSTRELFALFPAGGPLMQGVKIAGLPKPSGCK